MNRRACAAVVLLLFLLATSCAVNSELTDVWSDPSYHGIPAHNVLVIAVRREAVRRRLVEDAYAQALTARGVGVATSYHLFPQALPDTQDVIAAIQKNGYDAVLVTSRLESQPKTTYIPGALRRSPVTFQDYMGRFHTYWTTVEEPGYTETDSVRRFQTEMWTTREGGKLIWSGTLNTSEAPAPGGPAKAIDKYVLPALEKQGLVPKRPK